MLVVGIFGYLLGGRWRLGFHCDELRAGGDDGGEEREQLLVIESLRISWN